MTTYHCPTCKRIWTRNVATCLHCIQATIPHNVPEESATILAETTVHIPSLLAPEPPYILTLLQTPMGEKILTCLKK